MAEYGYEDLQKRIFDELKTAITESGEKAITSGLSELMKKKLSLKGINIDTKELTAFLEQQIDVAMSKVKPKKIKSFDYGLVGADNKTIQKALKSSYDAYMNAETDKQIETTAKKFISTIEIAKQQAVKIGEDLLEEYNYLFLKDSSLSDSLSKSLNNFKQKAIKELSSINLKKILDESIGDYSGTKTQPKKTETVKSKPQPIKKENIIPEGTSEELDDYKQQLEEIADNYEALSQLSKNSPMLKGVKETIKEITEDYPELEEFFNMLKSGMSLDDVFDSQQWKNFSSEILEEEAAFSKTVDQIYDERDALDENLQKQKQITEAKKETVQIQEEINKAEEETPMSSDLTSAILEGLKQAKAEVSEVKEKVEEIKTVEKPVEPISIDDTLEDKLKRIKDEYADFEEMVYGGDAVHKDDKLEYFDRLRTALQSLTEEDLDNLDLGKKFSIDKFAAKLETTTEDMHLLFEEVYNLGDNDDWSDEYTVLEGVDEEYKSIYKDIKYICEVLDIAKIKNKEAFEEPSKESLAVQEKKDIVKETEKEIASIEDVISVSKENIQTKENETQIQKEVIDNKNEEIAVTQKTAEVSKETANEQIDNYQRIKQKIIETREEIEKLNSQDLQNLKIPKYVDDVYRDKSAKYQGFSDSEFNEKIKEKSTEGLSQNTHDFRVQIVSILAMIDEAKRRGKELTFKDLISGSPDDLQKAQNYFEKIVIYISALNDESFIDDIPQKLAAATQKLRDLKNELKDVAENSNNLNFFDYKINGVIEELSGKRKGINSEEADSLLRLLKAISAESGKDTFIENYTDNEKIIAGVNKRIAQLKDLEEQAAQHAREAALAEKQQAEANEQTSNTIKEQTVALVQNTEAQETNIVSKNVGNIPLPNSIKGGFKDESGIVSGVVSSEVISLEELKNKIFEVRDAIESKTLAFSEELSTVERVVGDERNSLNLLRDKLAEIKGYTEELYNQIGNIGKIDFSGKIKVDGLSTLLSSLKDDKLNTKLTAIYTYLDDFAKAVNSINFKNNLTEELNTILSKGEELKNLANILKKVNKSSIKDVKNNVDSKNTEALKKYNAAYKVLIDSEEKFQAFSNKKETSLLSEKEAVELSKIISRRKEAKEIIEETTKILTVNGNKIKELSDAQDKYTSKVEETTEAFKAGAEARAKMEETNNRSSLESGLQKEIEAMEKMASMSHKYTGDFRNTLKDEIDSARLAFNGTDEEIEEITLHLKEMRENVPADAFENTFLTLDKYGLRIQKFLAQNTAMSEEFKIKLQEIYNTIQKYEDVGGDIDLKSILSDIVKIEKKVTGLGQTGKSTADKLKQQLQHIWRQDFARYFGLYDIIRYIRQISDEVIKVDTALTELRKVSDATNERLQQSLQKSTETAKDLGSTIDDVIKVTSDWARLGYNVDDAEELARVTTLFKNVGDNMSAEDASSFMISTLKGFEMEADQAMDIADKFNEVANNFAIDTMGIGDALQRSAASFNAANTDLNESIALITATNAVVQNPESVGTMWKTVSARIRGAKAE